MGNEPAKRALTFMVGLIVIIGTIATWASHAAPTEWIRPWYAVSLSFTTFGGILAIIVSMMD